MSDLTAKEQKAVRTALRFLRLRVGAWKPLVKALRYEYDSIQKVASGVVTAVVMNLEPLITIGLAVILLDEHVSAVQFAGAALVVAAIAIMRR